MTTTPPDEGLPLPAHLPLEVLRAWSRTQLLMPRALERLDLSAYDLVISSESGPAKGVIPRADAVHVCYCHTPMRYLWDHHAQYRASAGLMTRIAMDATFTRLRMWDVTAAQRVDAFAANSNFVRQRIEKFYRRPATVVPPPVDVDAFCPSKDIGPSYLWVGQLVPYKRPDLAVEAFNALGLPLLIVGAGAMEGALRRRAQPNIRFEAKMSFAALKQAYAQCRGLIFTAEEDFGIVPVEAMASGRPVIAYGRGGALDTVTDGVSGLFFDEQSAEALADAVTRFDRWLPDFNPQDAVTLARRFSPERFDRDFLGLVASTAGEAPHLAVAPRA